MLTFALGPKDVRVHVDDMASNMDYFCPTCGSPVIPRKGEVRRHHFAHKGGGSCADGWSRSYDGSEWHHLWQERIPKENQEVTLALGQIRHRADVLAGTTVVEFQRSTLTSEQFNDRNTFYQDLGYKVVWLYDLRDTFREGGMRKEPREDGDLLFSWDNPRKAFRAYDLERPASSPSGHSRTSLGESPSAPSTSWRRTSTRTLASAMEQPRGESTPRLSGPSCSTPAGARGKVT